MPTDHAVAFSLRAGALRSWKLDDATINAHATEYMRAVRAEKVAAERLEETKTLLDSAVGVMEKARAAMSGRITQHSTAAALSEVRLYGTHFADLRIAEAEHTEAMGAHEKAQAAVVRTHANYIAVWLVEKNREDLATSEANDPKFDPIIGAYRKRSE